MTSPRLRNNKNLSTVTSLFLGFFMLGEVRGISAIIDGGQI
jgi:hypothetical protein